YYPEEKLKLLKKKKNINEWYRITLVNMVKVLEVVASKYTRSKVRKALPKEYSYIIEELIHESLNDNNKHEYIYSILNTIISTGSSERFICAIAHVIQRLTIDSLHVIGDIYDRGPGAHLIMDLLCDYHNVDIQWGNHDVIWMGAAAGSAACMANVLRMSLRYANLETLEDGYGINLLPLATFAMDVYGDDPCTPYMPKTEINERFTEKQARLVAQMHKAIAIIQFKLEGQVIARRPEFKMDDRNLLHKIDFEKGTVNIEGVDYPLKDPRFETVNPADPYALTPEEADIVERLLNNFTHNMKLEKHVRCLYSKGSLYLVRNNNLLFHSSMPLNEDGSLKEVEVYGKIYKGKALFDAVDKIARAAFYEEKDQKLKEYAQDYMWYLWCGPDAPPFDKDKMATFERYLIADKTPHKETLGYYLKYKDRQDICETILQEFGLVGEHCHIINGHTPVKTIKGESPIKGGGKRLVIDGGFSKPYQSETGIAGYTLIYNSYGLLLAQHEPFCSVEKAVREAVDIKSFTRVVESVTKRTLVGDTDIGDRLKGQIKDLKMLLAAYRSGIVFEKKVQ
ncbi:MAG: fructose-1,6-bisphosphatase, partial [Bacteroidales bacterium]|nr:fructose-1,6-bisphosphatase [Bacteroidales bacterium]